MPLRTAGSMAEGDSKNILARQVYKGRLSLFEHYQYSDGGLKTVSSTNSITGVGFENTQPTTNSKYYILKEIENEAVRFAKNKAYKDFSKECKAFAKRFKGWKASAVPALHIVKYYSENCFE